MNTEQFHTSVMVNEVLEALKVKPGGKYIDATLGTGGHTSELTKAGALVLGIEADPEMLSVAKERLMKEAGKNSPKLVLGNFRHIDKIAKENGFEEVDGILFDLGVSNLHLTSQTRGFSFGSPEAPLDMRLDPSSQGVKGSDLLNMLRKDQLTDLFMTTLNPRDAKFLAEKVTERREFSPFNTVGDLLNASRVIKGKPGLNQATLPFLAIRMAVNSELSNLEEALPRALSLIKKGGKLVVISFHSGEDRIVKKLLKNEPILPSEKEIAINPRARSAKMRVLEKI